MSVAAPLSPALPFSPPPWPPLPWTATPPCTGQSLSAASAAKVSSDAAAQVCLSQLSSRPKGKLARRVLTLGCFQLCKHCGKHYASEQEEGLGGDLLYCYL